MLILAEQMMWFGAVDSAFYANCSVFYLRVASNSSSLRAQVISITRTAFYDDSHISTMIQSQPPPGCVKWQRDQFHTSHQSGKPKPYTKHLQCTAEVSSSKLSAAASLWDLVSIVWMYLSVNERSEFENINVLSTSVYICVYQCTQGTLETFQFAHVKVAFFPLKSALEWNLVTLSGPHPKHWTTDRPSQPKLTPSITIRLESSWMPRFAWFNLNFKRSNMCSTWEN